MSNRLSFREMNPVTIDEKMKIIKNILYDIY